MYLIDTNVLSEARRGDGPARRWLRTAAPEEIFLSVVTLGEIMKGITRKAISDPGAAQSLRAWLERLRQSHSKHILIIDEQVALEWGRLAAKRPQDMADTLIAATARVHDKVLVTRNTRDFADLNVALLDPWGLPG